MLILFTAILYNENIYLDEWIKFHFKQDVEYMYIYIKYHNKSNNILFNKIKNNYLSNSNIKFIHILHKPYSQHYHFFKHYYQKHINDWMAIIDIDEFLYSPLKDKKITDIIDIYEKEKKYAIGINWKCFGSNNIEKNPEKKVLHKFTKCAEKYHGINTPIKSLFKINCIDINNIKKSNIHKYILKKSFKYYTTTGINFIENNKKNLNKLKKIRKEYLESLNLKNNFNINFVYTYPEDKPNLVINHYIVRSKEEYLLKIKNNPHRIDRYNLKNFNIYNNFLNKVENKDILNKL